MFNRVFRWFLYILHFFIVVLLAILLVLSIMYGTDETIKILKIK